MAKKRGKRVNHEGTIYQRKNGRWCGQLSTPDGRETVYADDPAGVLEQLEAMKANLAKGLPPYDQRHTLGAYLVEWIAGVSNVRRTTWESYEMQVRYHLLPSSLAKTALVKLTRQQVLTFYRQKMQAGLSSTSVRMLHTVLGRALREAQEAHLIPENVCSRLRIAPPAEHEMLYLSRQQATDFLELMRPHRSYALFALALSTGMRQGELLGLRWKDVDLEGKKPALQLRVQALEVKQDGHYLREPAPLKTKRSRRRIDLGPSMVQVLRAHEARQKLEKRMAGDDWHNLGLVFPNPRGELGGHAGLYELFRRWAKKADLPEGIRFHDLRHTAATLALERGESIKAVAALLGDTEATVMRVYAHVTPLMQESLTATLDQLIGPSATPLQYSLQSEGDTI